MGRSGSNNPLQVFLWSLTPPGSRGRSVLRVFISAPPDRFWSAGPRAGGVQAWGFPSFCRRGLASQGKGRARGQALVPDVQVKPRGVCFGEEVARVRRRMVRRREVCERKKVAQDLHRQ